jgi:hypothetical protein
MKKIVKNLLSELYSDDSLLDCLDYVDDFEGKLSTIDNVIDLLNDIKDNIVG